MLCRDSLLCPGRRALCASALLCADDQLRPRALLPGLDLLRAALLPSGAVLLHAYLCVYVLRSADLLPLRGRNRRGHGGTQRNEQRRGSNSKSAIAIQIDSVFLLSIPSASAAVNSVFEISVRHAPARPALPHRVGGSASSSRSK
jgi:hypothetical protein